MTLHIAFMIMTELMPLGISVRSIRERRSAQLKLEMLEKLSDISPDVKLSRDTMRQSCWKIRLIIIMRATA